MGEVSSEIEALVSQSAGEPGLAAKILSNWRIPDAIEFLDRLSPEVAVKILLHLPEDMVTRIFNTAGLNRPSHLLEKLPEERAIRLLGGAHPDRRAEIFRSLSRETQGRLFDQLNEDAKTSLSRILKYPADQAGSIMTTEFVSVPASWMVKQVIDHIRSSCAQTEQIYAVYLVDPQSQRLLQAVSLRELLIANPEANIRSASPQKKPITVTPSTDPVDYALNARWNEARGGRSRETGFR